MSIKRKFSNISDTIIEEPLKSTILCEYYLWVRWCNIREVNGYYIYNGMKGNKLSFVHQQNSKLIIYFHTIMSDHLLMYNQHQNDHSYSFFSTNHPSFLPQQSIPEHREEDHHEIKLNLPLESPSSSSHSQSFNRFQENTNASPKFSVMATNGYSSNNNSNNSTPCSSPPQSPRDKLPSRRSQPKLTPDNSIDDYLYNHWVIKYDNDILYYTKDKQDNGYDNEYPPSYGWKYNEKNQSELPKTYLENANDLINFGAPPPGITRIPIIPEPMITFLEHDHEITSPTNNDSNNSQTNNDNHNDTKTLYPHGSLNKNNGFHHGMNGYNNGNKVVSKPPFAHIPIPFDLPVQMVDIVFEANSDNEQLGFGIRVDVDSQILEVNNIKTDCQAYQVGLKQGIMYC